MTETEILPGKHKCGKKMDIRTAPVKENDDIFCHMVYGICKSCKVVFLLSFVMRPEEPIDGFDIIIDWNIVAKEGKLDKRFFDDVSNR